MPDTIDVHQRALDLLTDAHKEQANPKDVAALDKDFQQKWSELSATQKVAVEAEMKNNERVFQQLYPNTKLVIDDNPATGRAREFGIIGKDPVTGRPTTHTVFKEGDAAAAAPPSKPFQPAPPAAPTEKPIDYSNPSTENEDRIVKRLYAPGSDDKSRPLIDELSHGGKFTRADCERWLRTHNSSDANYKTVAELDRNWEDPAVKALYEKSAAATGKKVLGAITHQKTDTSTDISLASMAKAAGYDSAEDMKTKNSK